MYFTGNDYCLSALFHILDSNNRVSNWIPTRLLSEKVEPFDTNLRPNMSNLSNGKVILKFNNSVLLQKYFLPVIVTF